MPRLADPARLSAQGVGTGTLELTSGVTSVLLEVASVRLPKWWQLRGRGRGAWRKNIESS
jgi:hypothetical protein